VSPHARVLAVSGGIGGAKLALGLQRALPPGELAVLVNTGDDFRHLGLAISPDLDTVLYTLAGVANTETGWGRADETWNTLAELGRIGGPTWFRLGDRDLAVHIERTRRLAAGESLTVVTQALARAFGVPSRLLPMTDDIVATRLDTDEGPLEFQDYFVRRRCEPRVTAVRYAGAERARPSPAALELLAAPALECVVLCPSNPYLSLGPILALPALRAALAACAAPVVVVSPVIGGRAVKGPTVKLMRELEVDPSPAAILEHYAGLVDGLMLDTEDAALAPSLSVPTMVTRTLMQTLEDRDALARAALDFAAQLARPAGGVNARAMDPSA
jgi:LPPG:FO 2-phospho-L-lactate transferase